MRASRCLPSTETWLRMSISLGLPVCNCSRELSRVLVYPQSGRFMTDKNADKAKGRAKEAAGALTGNKRLKNEGRVDQAKGSAKNAVDKVVDTVAGRKGKQR